VTDAHRGPAVNPYPIHWTAITARPPLCACGVDVTLHRGKSTRWPYQKEKGEQR
jgi:hypothetical protein